MSEDLSEFMWREFDKQHVDFPEPAMERMFESKFKRNYTVYMLAHFASRIITLDDKFQLPDNSILHVADNFFHMDDCTDTPRLDDNLFVQNEVYMKYLYHIRDFDKGPVEYPEKYIYRQAGLPSRLLEYRSKHGSEYKYLNALDMLPTRKTALTIINHNPLFRIKVFGRLKMYRRVQQILASILNTVHKLAPLGKNQFIVLPWGEEYYDKALFLRNREKLTFTTIKKPDDLHYILMMHLVNYFWDTATTSMFSKLPEETYEKVYFVFNTGDKYLFYNLRALKAMDSNNRVYRKLFNQLNLLSVLGRPNSNNEESKQLIEEINADDAIITANKPTEHADERSDDTPVNKVYEPKVIATIPGSTRDVVETVTEEVIDKLNRAVPVSSKPTPVRGINKTAVSIEVPQATIPVTETKKDAKTVNPIVAKGATNTTKLRDIKDAPPNNSKLYITELDKDTDDYIDSVETLTPAAKNHFKKVAKKYKTLEIDGEPLEKILESDDDLTLKDTKLDNKVVGDLPDESSLECSVHTYDKDYLEKTYKKHIAGVITSFQKSGVYLVDVKTEKTVTDLHNYTTYSCQYEDIDGKKSTIKFKLPNINEQGIVKIDGVKQYIKKQRFPLPIVKINDKVVSLTSNYNKSRVIRNSNKAHSYLDYVHSFLTDKDKANCKITYGRDISNLPLAYEYTQLASKYSVLEFTSRTDLARYSLFFNYADRINKFDGKPELLNKLEAQYGVYFGKTNDIWLFADNTNRVYAVKKTGGEIDIGCYSILDVCKLALNVPAYNKLKPLSEWVTLTILDLNIPIIFMLAYRYGLRNTLDYIGAKYTITENRSKTIVGENTIEGTEDFVRDAISGDIPGYDDSIENYGKDTVVCYEGIWKDNLDKRDSHDTKRYAEIDAEIGDILTRIRKKYDKGLTDNEIREYIKHHLYTKGSTLVLSRKDVDSLNKKYNVTSENCTWVVEDIVTYSPPACSCGKCLIPIYENVFEEENAPLNEINYFREVLYDHEIYFIDNIIDMVINAKHNKNVVISEEFLDGVLLYLTSHEEGHSKTPKKIVDEIIRTHTLDATEIYAQECALAAIKEWAKDKLTDKELTEHITMLPSIFDFVKDMFSKVKHMFGMEALGRPVKPRLDKVKLFLTLRSNNVQFNNCQVQVRAMVITVALGTKASCTRRITNYDGSVFTTPGKNDIPRDLIDKACAYLQCGKRKISKAEVVWVPADKIPDRSVLDTPRLTPVEYKKMTSKLCINENKVRPPKGSNEDWSIGFEDISDDVKYVPKPDDIHIKFADRVLHINRYPLAHSLIVAGLEYFDLSNYDMAELESKDAYYRLLMDKKLSINYIKGMDSFYDLFVDNMTYQVLKMMHEPTTVRDLLIRATVLLTTTDHLPASSGYNHRIRGYEQFAGVVYNELAREFANYKSKNGANNKFSINPDAIYLRVLQNASMLNAESGSPIEDMTLMCDMTYGGVGGRSADSFVISDRHYDKSDVGVVSESTVDNQKVAFNSALSYNPNIVNTLGMAEDIPQDKLKASQILSPHSLLFPFSTSDDSKRLNFIKIQSAHLVPTDGYDKMRVRTGYERVLAHRCGKNFAGVAKANGKVTAIDEKARLVEVTYVDGTKEVYPYGSELMEFDSMELDSRIACNVKLGQKVAKGDIITYNSDYFKKDAISGQVDMSLGTLANVIFMEMDTTLEDSFEMSSRLSEKLTMHPVNTKTVSLSGKSLIHKCLPIGSVVSPTDDLMIFEEDPTATEGMNTDDEALAMLSELNRRTPSAGHAGKIIRIDAYYSCDPSEMHPTVHALVKQCVEEKNRRAKLAKGSKEEDDYPASSMIKEGAKYKGVTFDKDTVMFIFHIQEDIKHNVGDKLVVCNQLKATCGGIFPKPVYTESGVEVDMLFSMMSTNKRIVLSPFKFGITSQILTKIEDDICLEYFGEPRDKK